MKIKSLFCKDNVIKVIMLSLLIMVVLSFSLVGNLLARYSTGARNSETARVAKFKITESGISTITISSEKFRPGFVFEQPVEVTNESEVAVSYVLAKTTTGNLPLRFELNDRDFTNSTYSDTIEPNSEIKSYVIKIIWPESENNPEYAGMVDSIKLMLTVNQVD